MVSKTDMYLFFDPRSQDEIVVGVSNGDRRPTFFIYKRNDKISLLEFIKKKLQVSSFKFQAIIVVPGPGGFSNVRGAVATANALGFALGIPVVAIKPKKGETREAIFARGTILAKRAKSGTLVMPAYGKEPNITFPEKSEIRISKSETNAKFK